MLTILYHRKGTARRNERVAPHAHPFWQAEWVRRGRACFVLDGQALEVGAGSGLWIPPGARHGVRYPCATSFFSIKFAGGASLPEDQAPTATVLSDAFTRAVGGALYSLLPEGEWIPPRERGPIAALLRAWTEGLAAAPGSDPAAADEGAAQKARELLGRHRPPPRSVRECADALGFSPNHLSAAYRQRFGESLKTAIDHELARRAAGLLAYGDRSVAAIAEQLDFPDAFGFSRFFKRIHGIGPLAYRREVESGKRIVPALGN
ncbi:MAG: helix-turn-helix domain-containing protein [Puniceicoccaceae bacterium]